MSPHRVLPYDVSVTPRSSLGAVLKRGRQPSPPTLEELQSAGLLATEGDPDLWFSADEQATADWLRQRGLSVASVRRRDGRHLKTPDAAATAEGVTVGIKRAAPTKNAIVQRIRVGRKQSRRVVVDLRGGGATRSLAHAALQLAVAMYGDHLDEVVLIIDGDLGLGWTRG